MVRSAKKAGWELSRKIRFCWVERKWRGGHWEAEEQEVFGRSEEVCLGEDDL